MCLAEQTLKAWQLTLVSSDAANLEAITQNQFLLRNKNVCLQFLPCAEEFIDHRKLIRQTQAYADLIRDRFRKEYLPTMNSRKKWQSTTDRSLQQGDLVWVVEYSEKQGPTTDRSLQQGDLVWVVEDSEKRGLYKIGRVTETIKGSDNGSNEGRSLQEARCVIRFSTFYWRRWRCFHDGGVDAKLSQHA